MVILLMTNLKTLKLTPVRSTYKFNQLNDVIVNEVIGGFSRSRLDFINSSKEVVVSWELNNNQYEYFQAFFIAGINNGADWYNINLILNTKTAQTYVAKFVKNSLKMTEFTGFSYQQEAVLEVKPNNNDVYLENALDTYELANSELALWDDTEIWDDFEAWSDYV